MPEQGPKTGPLPWLLSFSMATRWFLFLPNPRKVMVIVMATDAWKGWLRRPMTHLRCRRPVRDTMSVG